MNSSSPSRLFILGAPRSGTTFLASLLIDTSFGSPVETHFITKYHKRLDSYGDLSQRPNFISLATDILAERPVMQWGLDITAEDLFQELSPRPTFLCLIDHLLLAMRRKKVAQPVAWGDKTPHYLSDWPILLELFPDAKFIFIARDGRDVTLSLLKKPWGPSTVIGCAFYWARLNREKPRLKDRISDTQLMFLSYENLLTDAEKRVRELYRFLAEPLDEESLEKLIGPTKHDNAGKWRSVMTSKQIRQFEAVAGDELMALGYSLNCEKPRLYPGEILVSRILEGYGRARFLFRANVIDTFKIRILGKEPFAD